MTTRARIQHTLILWFILVDYGVYSVAVALEKMSGFFRIGGLFALLAAIAVATRKPWSKPPGMDHGGTHSRGMVGIHTHGLPPRCFSARILG
jgi:hypothetical protein